MKYFNNTKLSITTFVIIAALGFGFSLFFNTPEINEPTKNNTDITTTSSIPASQDERPNLLQQPAIKINSIEKLTDSIQLKYQAEDPSQDDNTNTQSTALAREEALAKTQQCHESSIDEVGYITEAYNQNTIDSNSANQQILHQMKTCNRRQVATIVQKIFNDSDDATHSMALLLDLLPQMDRTLPIISAIKQQTFSNEDMKDLIAMTEDQPTGIKQALIPSIVKNDNLDDFLSLTQQDNFFNSIEDRTGSYPSADQASNMIQRFIISERNNIKTEGEIYNYLLDNNPNPATLQQLTKIAFNPNQQY